MMDNRQQAIAFVLSRHSDAAVVHILGIALKSDGTINVDAANSRWIYTFQYNDGTEFGSYACPSFSASDTAAYSETANRESPSLTMTTDIASALLDATVLVNGFHAQTGCVGPHQTSSDILVYVQQASGDPLFTLQTSAADSQTYMGNPLTGVATAYCP